MRGDIMSSVDLSTGKISGCKKGSLNYRHEQGHLAFNKKYSEYSYTRGVFFEWIVFGLVIATIYNIGKLFALSAFLLYICMYLAEETWCWWYAYGLIKKTRRK